MKLHYPAQQPGYWRRKRSAGEYAGKPAPRLSFTRLSDVNLQADTSGILQHPSRHLQVAALPDTHKVIDETPSFKRHAVDFTDLLKYDRQTR